MSVLDEPCAKQSDPAVLDLHQRAHSKVPTETQQVTVAARARRVTVGVVVQVVKRLERADKNAREIEQWIENIGELHKSRPPASVQYRLL